MGKIVKFCASCEESFAEKFSFCPNCASELSPFEMKPVAEETPILEDFTKEQKTSELSNATKENVQDTPIVAADESILEIEEQVVEEQAVFEPVSFLDEDSDDLDNSGEKISDDVLEIEVEEPNIKEEIYVAGDIPEKIDEKDQSMATMFSADDEPKDTFEPGYSQSDEKGAYHVTVVSEKAGSVRNSLLLGAFVIIIFGFMGLLVYSLFANLDDVASLSDDDRLIALLNDVPMEIIEEEKKSDDDTGGGGGGGGTNNPKPATGGELPNQTMTLQPPPKVLPRLPNPSLPQTNYTKGPDTNRERTTNAGIPGALKSDSGGPGSGGGLGTGAGGGIGPGDGPGEGPGSGGGRGGGSGGGVGSGTGTGGGGGQPPPPPPPSKPPPPPPAGPTVGIKILSKPKPGYTDEARQNNVRGVVRVKVAFLSSGRIGSVSVVSGLPHGLTEKALAAARQIQFTPPMRNGVPYSVNKTVVFNFNIY